MRKHTEPSELARHRLADRGNSSDRRIELLDEIIPETMEGDCRPDAAGPEPELCKDEGCSHNKRDGSYERVPYRTGPVVRAEEHEREVPGGPDSHRI